MDIKNIDEYILINKKTKAYVYIFIMINIIIILFLIIFAFLFHYKLYYVTEGCVIKENDVYYVDAIIPIEKIIFLKKNNVLKIDKKNYNFKIKEIDNNIILLNNIKSQKIRFIVNLDEEYCIENLFIKIHFQINNEKIIYYLKRLLR